MNLTIDPWIPVIWRDGRLGEVSLQDAFAHGEEIADLAVRPPERIALMRLLLCVAHAALDGPRDFKDWSECRKLIPKVADAYLKQWHRAFELFGNGQRFLQIRVVKFEKPTSNDREDDEGNVVDKLDLALACGNNSTLFDNAAGSDRKFTPAQLALMLLTFQSFSPAGLIGIAHWNGKPTAPNKSSTAAVCIAGSPLHAFVRQSMLLATVHVNLIRRELFEEHAGPAGSWGCPIWEKMPTKPSALSETTRTLLGRLVPITRAVWLDGDRRTAIIAKGLDYPVFDAVFAEPSTTVVHNDNKRKLLRAAPSRSVWRQLAAITTLRKANGLGGPLALRNIFDTDSFDLWLGALATHPRQAAKIVDTVESVFRHVPVALTQSAGQQIYNEGVHFSERLAARLGRAIAVYRRVLKDEIERGEGRERGLAVKARATLHYWTAAERLVPELFRMVSSPPRIADNRYRFGETNWGKGLFVAALAAYDLVCPHQTPRQLQAHVLGRARLTRSADAENDHEKEKEGAP